MSGESDTMNEEVPTKKPVRLDLDHPRWDQNTFSGRLQHFFTVTDPRNVFASSESLDKAQKLVLQYKQGTEPPDATIDEIWDAKHLYDSAFHPQTGEKQNILGRMSFQVPGNMLITGCMMAFYRT
eukprot:586666_1